MRPQADMTHIHFLGLAHYDVEQFLNSTIQLDFAFLIIFELCSVI